MCATTPTSIFFHPDAIEGEDKDLVGRRSAGQSFLKGYLRNHHADTVRAVVENTKAGREFDAAARALGETRPIVVTTLRRAEDFGKVGSVFFPSPGFQTFPWLRHRQNPAACSFIGITHTVSTRRVMRGFHTLLSDPVYDWDAVICTSHAVQSVVTTQMEQERAFYTERFGAAQVPMPQFPVIPLGIETADFAPLGDARTRLRGQFGIADDAVVVMTMGRLSVVEKANPIPMMIALEQVAARTGREIHLWITGWTNRAEEEALHQAAAEALCQKVVVHFLDGRDKDLRRNLWAAADIFSLPADSIQETFGLVPVEAMAAGLPVVMPDWDGFRDTVVHGETGFLVPTRMASAGMGEELAARFADGRDGYLQYLTLVQSHVQIDVPAYAEAFEALVTNADLRKRMGRAAMAHARATLDWDAVIPQYQALADELAVRREAAKSPAKPSNPYEIDPFALYAGYPSGTVGVDDVVTLARPVKPSDYALMNRLSGRDLYRRHVIDAAQLDVFCGWLATHGPASIRQIALGTDQPLTRVAAAVLILAKSDIVRLVPPALRAKNNE